MAKQNGTWTGIVINGVRYTIDTIPEQYCEEALDCFLSVMGDKILVKEGEAEKPDEPGAARWCTSMVG